MHSGLNDKGCALSMRKADRSADMPASAGGGMHCWASSSPEFTLSAPGKQPGTAPEELTAPAQAQMLAECLSHLLICAACVLPARDITISLHLCRTDSCHRGRVASCQGAEVGILEASTRAGCSASGSLSSRVPARGKSPACQSCVARVGEVSKSACSECDLTDAEPVMLHVRRHGGLAASAAG